MISGVWNQCRHKSGFLVRCTAAERYPPSHSWTFARNDNSKTSNFLSTRRSSKLHFPLQYCINAYPPPLNECQSDPSGYLLTTTWRIRKYTLCRYWSTFQASVHLYPCWEDARNRSRSHSVKAASLEVISTVQSQTRRLIFIQGRACNFRSRRAYNIASEKTALKFYYIEANNSQNFAL